MLRYSCPHVDLGFSFCYWTTFMKHKWPWWSSCTNDLSLNITLSKVSSSVYICWHHSSCFCWFTVQMSRKEVLGLVLIQLMSSLCTWFIVLQETLKLGHSPEKMLKSHLHLAMSSSLAPKDYSNFYLSSFLWKGWLGESMMVFNSSYFFSECK